MSKTGVAIRACLIAGLVTATLHSIQAQTEAEIANAEYGSISELARLSRVFIHTTSIESRRLIAKELVKDPRLTVINRKEDADFTLYFKLWSEETLAAGTTIYTLFGSMVAAKIVNGKDEPRLRICWDIQKSKRLRWHDPPAESATREFLKALKKARDGSPTASTEEQSHDSTANDE
jgi:hypothetical protein